MKSTQALESASIIRGEIKHPHQKNFAHCVVFVVCTCCFVKVHVGAGICGKWRGQPTLLVFCLVLILSVDRVLHRTYPTESLYFFTMR